MFVSTTSPLVLYMYNFVVNYFIYYYFVAFLAARLAAKVVNKTHLCFRVPIGLCEWKITNVLVQVDYLYVLFYVLRFLKFSLVFSLPLIFVPTETNRVKSSFKVCFAALRTTPAT